MNKPIDPIEKEFEEFKNNTSSKLETVKIKLYDYSYFHSTSKIQKQRWVKRTRLKNKLDSLINQSNSKCGAYLVTGYRGVGKSSIVQELIEEGSFQKNSPFPLKSIVLRIIFLTIIFQLLSKCLPYTQTILNINLNISQGVKFICLSTLLVILVGLLCYYLKINGFNVKVREIENKNTKKNRIRKILPKSYSFFTRTYSYVYNKISNRRYLQVLTDYSIIIGAVLLTYLITYFYHFIIPTVFIFTLFIFFILFMVSGQDKFLIKRRWIKIVVLLLILVTYSYLIFHFQFSTFHHSINLILNTIWSILALWIIFYARQFIREDDALKKAFTVNRKLFIHINFGHDELDESDIFRLMAYNLKDNLKKKYKSFSLQFFEFSYKLVISLFLFFILVGNNDIYKNIKDLSTKIEPFSCNECKSTPPEQIKNYNLQATGSGDIKVEMNQNIESNKSNGYWSNIYCSIKNSINPFYQQTFKTKNSFALDLIILLIIYGIVWLIMRIINGKKYYKNILNSLNELINHIEAQVSTSKSAGANYSVISLNFSKQKNYPIADTREIERRLISILDKMRHLPFLYQRCEVVFIFDELDKLEPRNNNGSEIAKQSEISSGLTPESVRKRQNNVFKVLANMKYFLTTAKAKFIFLAGREMYDAALADVADRNSFLSSIFYDVIYVPSIFNIDNDDNEPAYTTDFVEKFICQQLMPYGSDDTYDLKSYNQFLINNFKDLYIPIDEKTEKKLRKKLEEEKNESKIEKKEINRIEEDIREFKIRQRNSTIAKQKREKIIFTLYHFIIYLTHLSNGSTKKMISLFEDYVEMASIEEHILFTKNKIKKGELYLRFDENAQHLFAMINYLAGPMIQKQNILSNNIYSDKLLVQTSYLTDHILKFHRQSFTDGSLELIPEIVDPNRSPELRSLLNEVIAGYSKTHLEKVSFNLPTYKFNRLIQLEISYLSKLNELASAAFDFSLDESLATKNQYLQFLKESTKSDVNANCAFSYILGELFLFDEQYEDAINYYSNALTRFNSNPIVDKKDFFFYLKVNLKLGLAFEKRKSYEAAFSYYQKSLEIAKTQNLIFREEIEFSKLSYQALLAKLFLIEKSNPAGVTLNELANAEKDFIKIMADTDGSKTYLFKSDFYYKLAILLYWKNQENDDYKNNILKYLKLGINAIINKNTNPNKLDKKYKKIILEEKIKDVIRIINKLFRNNKEKLYKLNQEEIKQLSKCLSLFGHFLLGINTVKEDKFCFMDSKFRLDEKLNLNANKIENAIRLFELAADLAKLNNDDKMFMWQQTKILYLTKYILVHNNSLKEKCLQYSSSILKNIIRAAYSMEDNIYKVEIAKFKNIFTMPETKNFLSKSGISLKRATVVVELEEAITLFSDIEMITKEKSISELYKRYNNTPYCLGTTSLNQILWLKNKFHLNYEIFNKYFFKIDNNCFLKPYIVDDESDGLEKTERINLEQFTFTNFYRWFNNLFSEEHNEVFINLNKELGFISRNEDIRNYKNKIFENILFDSLYCGLEIIRIYKSHGDSKLLSNLFMAKIHEYMILWTSIRYFYNDYYSKNDKSPESDRFKFMWYSDVCLEYFNTKENRENKYYLINYRSFLNHIDNLDDSILLDKTLSNIKTKLSNLIPNEGYKTDSSDLEKLIGKNRINLLDHVYYAEETRKLYHFLEDIPHERFGYKNELQNLFYLNDDFSDDRSHFFMANDRYELTKKQISSKIKDLTYMFYSSQYYEPDKYFITVPDREQE
ncbi:MAG: ATP-binding protein [Bacteroidales bacterium]|nr:MAG: ATP-binding protein [Bacteroidales bacterium]